MGRHRLPKGIRDLIVQMAREKANLHWAEIKVISKSGRTHIDLQEASRSREGLLTQGCSLWRKKPARR